MLTSLNCPEEYLDISDLLLHEGRCGRQCVVPSKVAAIPAAYQDVTGVTAAAGDVLAGKKFVDAKGALVTGSVANNGAIAGSIDGLTQTSYAVPAGYTSGGTVSLTNDIEEALAAI